MKRLFLDEGAARFWTAVFGGVTAVGLVGARVYSLVQYFDGKARDRENVATHRPHSPCWRQNKGSMPSTLSRARKQRVRGNNCDWEG